MGLDLALEGHAAWQLWQRGCSLSAGSSLDGLRGLEGVANAGCRVWVGQWAALGQAACWGTACSMASLVIRSPGSTRMLGACSQQAWEGLLAQWQPEMGLPVTK